MKELIKDNKYILDWPNEFIESYQRACSYFKSFDGVAGVGFGQKKTKNKYNSEIAIKVYVLNKKVPEDIKDNEKIPKVFEGYITDVTPVLQGKLHRVDNDTEYDTMRGGIRIGNKSGLFGTLGCIVRKRGDTSRDNVYLLSNYHVLYAGNAEAGDGIYQPGGPAESSNLLGPIQELSVFDTVKHTPLVVPQGVTPMEIDLFVDAAIARIDIDSKCLGSTCTKDVILIEEATITDLQIDDRSIISEITDVRDVSGDPSILEQTVFKIGGTTGRTQGIVKEVNAVAINVPEDINNPIARRLVGGIIQIEFDSSSTVSGLNGHNRPLFSEPGDSGSLILDEQNRVIGLTFFGSTAERPLFFEHPNSSGAIHIVPILDQLGICIPTSGGTNYGSCGATDGSGLTPSPGSGSGGGAIGMTGTITALKSKTLDTSGIFQPEPLSIKQQDHLTQLLETLRTTKHGRELHEAFAHVRREIGYLVRNRRPVTVTWHRNKGPGFFALFLNHLRGDLEVFPHKIGEFELSVLLDKMENILIAHGSNPLKETIEKYGEQMKFMLLNGHSVTDFIQNLNEDKKT